MRDVIVGRARAALLVAAALAMVVVGTVAVVPAAHADTDKYGNTILTPIGEHLDQTGVVILHYPVSLAGYTIDATAQDPADIQVPALQSAVIDSTGFAEIRNFAGRMNIRILSYTAPTPPMTWPPTNFPLIDHSVGVYRASSVSYTYSPEKDSYAPDADLPSPVIPATAAEAEHLIATTTSDVAPTSDGPGSDLTLAYSRMTQNGVGNYSGYSNTVTNYVYADAPVSLGSSRIAASTYSITVPGTYTTGGQLVASFDAYGLLVSSYRVPSATPAPTPTPTVPVPTPTASPLPQASSIDSHPLEAGTVTIDFGAAFAGYVVTSTTSDPSGVSDRSTVSALVDADGTVSLTNYAGFADITLFAPGQPVVIGTGPLDSHTMRHDVAAFRAQTVAYTYSPNYGGQYASVSGMPAPIIPESSDIAGLLIPASTSIVSPATWTPGDDVTLTFSNAVPTGVGIPTDGVNLTHYVYTFAGPTLLGTSFEYFPDGSYSFTVPGAYTVGDTYAATFDFLGRLYSWEPLKRVGPGPTPDPTATPTPDPTGTPAPTPDPTGTPTPTPDPTGTPAPTPDPTGTPTPTPDPTGTPSPTPDPTGTPTPTPDPTGTPSPTPDPTGTPAPDPTGTPMPGPTTTPTPDPTGMPTPTPDPSGTPSPTAIPDPTGTPTPIPDPTGTTTPAPTVPPGSTPTPTGGPTSAPVPSTTALPDPGSSATAAPTPTSSAVAAAGSSTNGGPTPGSSASRPAAGSPSEPGGLASTGQTGLLATGIGALSILILGAVTAFLTRRRLRSEGR